MKNLLCGFLLLVSACAHSTLAGAASVVLGQAGPGGVSAIITPDPGEIGQPANIWMGGVLNGTLYLRDGPTNWVQYQGGPFPIALTSAALPPSLQVSIVNFDISSVPGLDIYVGYGSTEAALSLSGHLAKVYPTLRAQAAPTGRWWNPNQPGRGFSIEIIGTSLFMAGDLYEDDGRATWLVSAGPMQDATTYVGRLAAFSNGQTLTGDYQVPAAPTDAGAVTLQFTDDSHGTLTWPGGSIPIERFRFSNAAAASFQPENGWWGNEDESGRWFFTEIQGDQMFMAGYMYDANGKPVWYESRGAMASPTTYQGDWYQYANGQTLTGPYKAPSAPTKVGTVRLEFSAPDQATLTLSDDLQPTAALSPESMSVNAPSRSRIINIQRPRRVPILLNRPDRWKGTFSYTYTLDPQGVVTYSKMNTTGTVTWVEDEVQPLDHSSTNYIILEGQVEATLTETVVTTTGPCPGTATATGNGTKLLSPSEGALNLKNDNSYTVRLVSTVTMNLTIVTPCSTSMVNRDIFLFIFLDGTMAYLNMHGHVPNDSSFPGLTTTRTWNFNAIQ